jgi:outer membrane DcaP-like protein
MRACKVNLIKTAAYISIVLFVAGVVQAQEQTGSTGGQELEQLKEKLDKLERQVQELKTQIGAAEQAQTPAQIPETPEAGGQGSEEKTIPSGTPEVPARKTTLDFFGHVMLDSGYDFKTNDPDWFDVIRPTKLQAAPGEFAPNGKVYFSVRQTRFGVKSSTSTRFGDLKTWFEFELFGTGVDAGQTTFRLRHAYGELGAFGAGQTWSPFMDIDVFPNSLEYWGPNGMVFFRNIQFRWTPIKDDHSELVLALERPGASADPGTLAGRIDLSNVRSKFDAPDVSGHFRATRDWGYVQLAGMLRKITWVDTNPTPALHIGDTVLGWGVNLTSNLNFSKTNIGRFEIVYGHGIENYMNDAPIDIGPKVNFGNPVRPVLGVPLPVLGVVAFLDHNWSDHFSSSIGYSMVDIKNSNAELPSDYHQGHYALTNLLYSPVPSVTVGGEFQYGRRVNFSDGFNANDYRLQFSFKYAWKKGFEF